MILVRFRHLNGNLKLAGSGNGIDLWGVSWVHTTLAISGRWGWFTGTCHGGAWLDQGNRIDLWGHAMGRTSLAGSGRWDWITGICDTGWWIGAMELFHGDTRHWLEWGNGVDIWRCGALAEQGDGIKSGGLPWGHTTLAGLRWWDRFMGVCRGTCNTGWIGAMGLIYGIHHGAHDWIGEMGLIWGGTPLGCDTGWDTSWGRDWIKEMGLICEDTTWGCDTGWMWMMRLMYRGFPWGRATGSGRWNWFVEANHGGAWHWLDLGEGIDLCGRIMRAHGTGWIGVMEMIHGGVSNDKVLYGCWIWMTIPCVLFLALR